MIRGSVRYLWAAAAIAATACSADVQDSSLEKAQEPLVRATADGGKDQVVLLYAQTVVNGQVRSRSCSATLIAPRVLLTAAHCLKDAWGNQVFAYWGSDFAADFSMLTPLGQTLVPPPPGQPSLWAQADSYEVHPNWDPALAAPDMAVVYLDRKPPFEPLPVARFRIDHDWVGKKATLVGWGASGALTADISQTVGGKTQRTGSAKILGSPTAADYHPEDPNAGMLVPAIRRNTLKTDGHAPNTNTCAGDSGSPLLVKEGGKMYVAGISSWTGLWCEDYSLWTRIDPFLSFIDQAIKRGGREDVVPHLECVAENNDGTLSAYFGYQNDNGVSVDVPLGFRNFLANDTRKSRPTHFLPGRHDWVFGVDFTRRDAAAYWLLPEHGPTTLLRATRHSPRCGEEVATQVACGGFCRAGLNSGCPDALPSDTQCISDCLGLTDAFPECSAEILAMNQCYAGTPPGEDHWMCNGDDFMPSSMDCADQESAFLTCLFGG
jgi:hypothetical protein